MYDRLCPGCGHRIAMNILDEIIEEKKLKEKVIFAHDVGCCSLLTDDVYYDGIMGPHGRVIPVSIGIKMLSDNVVISYMGDGAAYSIGFNELIHAAQRKDNLFIVVINNGVFAMTGGQKSTSNMSYNDFFIEDILRPFKPNFLARAVLSDKIHIDTAKQVLKEALESYLIKGGFNMVELLSPCPTNYHMSVKDCIYKLNDEISHRYKEFKESSVW